MLADRIIQALEVLGSDESVGGTLREQSSTYLGAEVDDLSLQYISASARVIYDNTFELAGNVDYPEDEAEKAALTMVLVAGMAIGKRLGIEDGEAFARGVGNVD